MQRREMAEARDAIQWLVQRAMSEAVSVNGDTIQWDVLIDYPRYFDPKTGLPCPVEIVVERLSTGDIPKAGPLNRIVAKLQGALASYAHLWR